MPKFTEATLKRLNLSEETTKVIEAAGEEITPELFAQAYDEYENRIRAKNKEILSEDKEFTKTFYDKGFSTARGEHLGIFDKQWKAAFSEIPVKDEQGTRPFSKLFELAKESLKKGGTKDKDELQTQLVESRKLFGDLETQISDGTHPALLEAQKAGLEAVAKFNRQSSMMGLESFLPPAAELTNSTADVRLLLSNYLDSSFSWGNIAEDGSFAILNKDGSRVTNKGATDFLDSKAIVSNWIDEKKFRKQSNGGDNKPPGTSEPPPGVVKTEFKNEGHESFQSEMKTMIDSAGGVPKK